MDMDLQAQLAAGQLSDSLKLELEDAQKKLTAEQEVKAKLTEANQSLQKVSTIIPTHGQIDRFYFLTR